MKPAVGAPVIFEGLPCRIVALANDRAQFASELSHTRESGKTVPRFITEVAVADMRWSDELGSWYLWGRVLSKGRSGILADQRKLVVDLRDRRLIAARFDTRERGSGPAGGEHLNLYCCLFMSGVDWDAEIARHARGEAMSAKAADCIAKYAVKFAEKLSDGYADPGADDSFGEEG